MSVNVTYLTLYLEYRIFPQKSRYFPQTCLRFRQIRLKMSQGKRFKEIRKTLHQTQDEFAKSIGTTRSKIGDIETDKQQIPLETATVIKNLYGVNFEWLLTGDGDKYPPSKLMNLNNNISTFNGADSKVIYFPLYDVKGAAGGGCPVTQENIVAWIPVTEFFIRTLHYISIKNLSIITVYGDSMEPTLVSGDLILVETYNELKLTDGIYVLGNDDLILIKRIQFLAENKVKLNSDNKVYEPFIINLKKDNYRIIGKVLARITTRI